jgi:hypothetical protein
MTGLEQTAVWLFAIFCTAVTVTSAARSWASARTEVAKANAGAYVDAHRAVVEAQWGPRLTVPDYLPKDGEL